MATESEWQAAQDEAAAAHVPVVVQFTGAFCQPCKRIAPVFDALAATHSGIFLRVDVMALQDLAVEQGVGPIPAFHWYRGGKLVDSMVGADEAGLRAKMAKWCGV